MGMKLRKVAIWLVLLTLWGGTMLAAEAASQKVTVFVNGIKQGEGGVLMDGKTYLPLRQLATAMNAIVEWDGERNEASLHKPNVHMFVYHINKEGDKPFGAVNKGFPGNIKVFAQVDNLQTEINAIKVTIKDPSGQEKLLQSQDDKSFNDNFWFVTEESEYKFDQAGNYTIQFQMRTASDDKWHIVSEKRIHSK
ncbi:copper amine oxidase N-terminal domain-containing protein [Paenibacillus sp. J5C_2022]|uniref:copper amine oxidase N-terminal domain-containing protein n=1 Tax=Paenibacillus sp. J5C2022 TaxID=2977129 RepID=UPI0021D19E04|nr:copper amine oxidase N-terminal domain-containing protein [Paenibacillus sp. J5C2022]MCU6709009.1 copper amine oxidase N-terminal domain-containing protein [Paenibacillus sp. J5C2022]